MIANLSRNIEQKINPFQANISFLYHLKTESSGCLIFSGQIKREYWSGGMGEAKFSHYFP